MVLGIWLSGSTTAISKPSRYWSRMPSELFILGIRGIWNVSSRFTQKDREDRLAASQLQRVHLGAIRCQARRNRAIGAEDLSAPHNIRGSRPKGRTLLYQEHRNRTYYNNIVSTLLLTGSNSK